MRRIFVLLFIILILSFNNCIVDELPNGNPMDPNTIQGLVGIIAVSQLTISNYRQTDETRLVMSNFNLNFSIQSVINVQGEIFALSKMGSENFPLYQLVRSPDGINFTTEGNQFGNGSSLDRLIYANGHFYAYSSGNLSIFFSSANNGQIWTMFVPTVNPPLSEQMNCVIGNNNILFAIFETIIYTSYDNGSNFSFQGNFAAPSRRQASCANHSDGLFIIGGYISNENTPISEILYTDSDFLNYWYSRDSGDFGTVVSDSCNDSFNGNSHAFAANNSYDFALISSDRITRTRDYGNSWECKRVMFSEEQSFSVGPGSAVIINNRIFVYSNETNHSVSRGAFADLD